MKRNVTLNLVQEIFPIKRYIDLFSQFSGINIQIINADCKPLKFCCLQGQKTCLCAQKSDNCNEIPADIYKELIHTRQPQIYICPAWLQKIIVPLLLDNELVGVLVAGESCSFRFNGTNVKAFCQLLFHIGNYIIKNESNPINGVKMNSLTPQQQILTKILKYIRDNYDKKNLTLKEVARNNGISYHYLSHLFTKEYNISFAQYREKIKMEAAANLLKDRKLAISQVSYSCGFEDPGYFSKVFKKKYKISPENFRQKLFSKKRFSRPGPAWIV